MRYEVLLEFLCCTQVRQSSEDMRICGCVPGGGRQVGVGI